MRTLRAAGFTALPFLALSIAMMFAIAFAFPSGAYAACVQLQTYPPRTVCDDGSDGTTSSNGTVSTPGNTGSPITCAQLQTSPPQTVCYNAAGQVVGADASGNAGGTIYTTPPASPTTPGVGAPVAFWKFDETSGTTAYDSSGNGNNGILENGATRYVGTQQGNKLSLDGADDRVVVTPVSANASNMSSFTVAAWVRPTTHGNTIVRKGNSAIARFNFGTTYEGKLYLRAGYSGQSGAWNTIQTLPLNTWSHVAVTYTFGTTNDPVFYINGTLAQNSEIQVPQGDTVADTSYLYIGNTHDLVNTAQEGFTSGFEGRMDNLRIYDAVLSANAIAAIRTPEPDPSQYSPAPFPKAFVTTAASQNNSNAGLVASLTAQLNALLAQVAALQGGNPSAGVSTNAATMASDRACPAITRALSRGSQGDDVRGLQQALIARGVLAAGNDTGFFGPLTEAAVQAFQRGANIASSGTPEGNGYGVFGPRTQAAFRLNCQ